MRQKNTIINFLIAILAIAGVGVAGCRKQVADLSHYQAIGDTKTDTLRLFNLLPDSSIDYAQHGYVLYVNDSMVTFYGRSLAYSGGGYYDNAACYGIPIALAIPAGGGTYNLKVAAYTNRVDTPPVMHPNLSRIVCQTTITVPAHSGFGNVFFYDSIPGKAAIRYMPLTTSDPGAPAPGTFKVRVVNYAYALEDEQGYVDAAWNSGGQQYNLQLQTADSAIAKGAENIPFGSSSPYLQYGYGTFQFMVYNASTSSYITNSGPLNDLAGTFDLSPNVPPYEVSNGASAYNYLYPNYTNNDINLVPEPTLHYGNIGSYQFSAGGCYTILVLGNMYAVILDRQYSVGSLDNFAKIQLVNAAPGQSDMQVSITAGSLSAQIASLPFGSSADPLIVPAGNVTCTFSSHGQTLYIYSTQVPRLGYYLLCYSTDLKKVPFVFPQVVQVTPDDYGHYSNALYDATFEFNKVTCLNLCADAGNIDFTSAVPILDYYGNYTAAEAPVRTIDGIANNPDIPYKGSVTLAPTDGIHPATLFNARLSAKRTDSLANDLAASLPNPFPVKPAPGTFTLVTAGLLNATDPSSSMRLIMVKHTNFIPKAQ